MSTRAVSASFARRLCWLLLSGSVLGLAGCAAPVQQNAAEPAQQSAERVARMLSGRYAGRPQSPGEDDSHAGELVRLDAAVVGIGTDGVEVSMSQRRGDGAARNFMLVFRPTSVATRLEGSFSPLGAEGRPAGSCPIEVSVQRDGFVARTDARTCRFGTAGEEVALIKEIAHDGERLIIGDRVVKPQSGETVVPDRVLELERVRSYAGWVGVRDSGTAWRTADETRIESDGVGVDPEDAAGVPLGVTLDLAPYRVREGDSPVLRLRVFDSDSGELLGQSWADPLATRLGIALPAVQVGLRRNRVP